jgi:hypothetical protein
VTLNGEHAYVVVVVQAVAHDTAAHAAWNGYGHGLKVKGTIVCSGAVGCVEETRWEKGAEQQLRKTMLVLGGGVCLLLPCIPII